MKIETDLMGERLRLRDCRAGDRAFLTEMWFDPENGKYLSDPDRAHADARYQRALDGMESSPQGYYLVAELAQTGERVGSCCMFKSGDGYDVGYCVHKSRWRKGYGGEALGLMLEWIRAHGGKKVTAEVAVENAASSALLRKFGFKAEKKARFQKYHMDVWYDSLIYEKEL